MSASTIFDFQINDVSRALVLPVGFRQRGVVHGMKWVFVVIMGSLQSGIEKSFSYSISYSYSNLKSPPVGFRRRGVVHGMKWVCVVIMGSLQSGIEKSFSYSISYSYSNLKSPIS